MITIAEEECPFCGSSKTAPYHGQGDRYCADCTRTWDYNHWFATHQRASVTIRKVQDWFSPQLQLNLEGGSRD